MPTGLSRYVAGTPQLLGWTSRLLGWTSRLLGWTSRSQQVEMQTVPVSQNARFYIQCSTALHEAGIVLRMPGTVYVPTTHKEVMTMIDHMRSISGTLLARTRMVIISKLKAVSDPRELSGKAKLNFDQDCFLLAVVKHVSDGSLMTIATASQLRRCVQCGAHAKRTCSGCRLVRYCGRKCQRIHWKEHHKSECH